MNTRNYIDGDRLRIRNSTSEDLDTFLASSDNEMNKLDPPVGDCRGAKYFSLYTMDDVLIGMCSLYNYTETEVELGIRIWNKNFWNKGYGTEAVTLLCEYIFSTTHTVEVFLKTPVTNIRALLSYKKNGFIEYGRTIMSGIELILMHKKKPVREQDVGEQDD